MTQNNPTILGTESIKKLLIQYSIPAIIATMAASLYNIVDRIFIGQGVGPLAISGLTITFPLMNVAAAFGSLVGAGGSTLVSIKMGQKDYDGATKVFGNVIMLNIVMGAAIMILGLVFLDPVLKLFAGSDDTIPYARDYMQIILLGNLITHIYLGLNSVMRSSGYPKKAMIATLLTVIINAVLDPIFIFSFGWGIRGAAIATILAQVIALIWIYIHFNNKASFIHFQKGIYKIKKRIVSSIFSIGMAPFMINICSCLVVILLNHALKRHGGDLAIGAYGIVNSVVMLFVMLVLGFNQGMQPIAGYNYGAQQHHRVVAVLKQTILYATCATTFAFIVGQFFPEQLAKIFAPSNEEFAEHSETLVALAKNGMRITLLVFPIVGFQMVVGNFFQSIGQAKKAVFLSSTRQLLFLVPLILILPNFYGLDGVWYSMPIADFFAAFLAAIMLYRQVKSFKKSHPAIKSNNISNFTM